MRKPGLIAIVAVLIAVLAVFAVSAKYYEKRTQVNPETTTRAVTTQEADANKSDRVLLDETEDGAWQLYYHPESDMAYVVHGDIEKEFNWGWSIKLFVPEIAYLDGDGDGEKDFFVKVLSAYATDDARNAQQYELYNLFMFKEVEVDGVKDLAVYTANRSTWREPFKEAITCEVTQLKSSKKFIQVAMNNADVSISYDGDTGITNNPYTYYAEALRDGKNRYYTLTNWVFNEGVYKFEDDKIVLDVAIIVEYEENETKEYIGDVTCDIGIVKGKLAIVPKTIFFKPLNKKLVTDPRDVASADWSVRITNTSPDPKADGKDINWIENQFDVPALSAKATMQFASLTSKIKCVESVEITQSQLVLTAFGGYTFSQRVEENGTYSVIIDDADNGSRQIDDLCIVGEANGKSTLTITFDKTYDQEDLKELRVKFGV